MSIIVMYGPRSPVVKILYSAGQFAKPRSSLFGRVRNQKLHVLIDRGDIFNDPGLKVRDRTPALAGMEHALDAIDGDDQYSAHARVRGCAGFAQHS